MKTSVEIDGYWGLHVNVVYLHHLMYNVFVSSGEIDVCLLSCLVILFDSNLLEERMFIRAYKGDSKQMSVDVHWLSRRMHL